MFASHLLHLNYSPPPASHPLLIRLRMPLDKSITQSASLQGGVEAVRDIRRTWPGYSARIIAVTADAFEASDACACPGNTTGLAAFAVLVQ